MHKKFSAATFFLLFAILLWACTSAPEPLPSGGGGGSSDSEPTATTEVEADPYPVVVPTSTTAASGGDTTPAEAAVSPLPLTGALAEQDAEISGLAWYSEYLIVLPQYPNFTETGADADGFIYAIPKDKILAFVNGDTTPIDPIAVPFIAPGLQDSIAGFEGYESITFIGNQAFLTIEAETDSHVIAYLVTGVMAPDLTRLALDTEKRTEILAQADIPNLSEESIFVAGGLVGTIYEGNGAAITPAPLSHLFNTDLSAAKTIPFPNIEYRVTDATTPDADGYFWVLNYFFPGDDLLLPANDPIAQVFGEGPTHAQFDQVERILQLQFTDTGIILVNTAPIQLALVDADTARNWGGLAALDDLGFILATDKFPSTILAFVAAP